MRISDWSSDVCSSDLSHPDNLKQIARELGVAHIVEGSVQKVGNDVLISVQLVDSRTDHHVWAESYQRTLDNIFGVVGEVRSEEHTSELQSLMRISYAVFCLKKKNHTHHRNIATKNDTKS